MKEEKPKKVSASLLEWGKTILCAVLLALLINGVLIVNASIPTASMETTVTAGARVLFNRLAYLGHGPERYDIIIFKFPFSDAHENYVKRVIGLSGEKVEIKEGQVYINDSTEPLDATFVNGEPTGDFGPYQIPEGCYFVMGDNREDSYDARYWPSPYISGEAIMGKAFLIYYPEIKVLKDPAG